MSADVKIVNFVHVVVPENMTLTVEKGATMTIHGILAIEGKLINNGTIILGNAKATADAPKAVITNNGSLVSSGSIQVIRGQVSNEGLGKLENKGVLIIANTGETSIGLSNESIKKSDGMKHGHILNTGTIHVKNTGGEGIKVLKDTKFENEGVITIGPDASITGKISGTQPVME